VKTTNYLARLAVRVFDEPLLIRPRKLHVILQAIGPRLGLTDVDVELIASRMPMDDEEDPDELDEARGEKPYAVTADGIAVINVSGTLVKKASWMDAWSGLQSYEMIRSEFHDAIGDPRIQGVLLDVDSPGGEVGGLFDLAGEIFAGRQQKPVYAIANDVAYSAAYAIASSAERLFLTSTGGVGSVGVIAIHVDQSSFDEKVGRKYTAVYAGAKKNDFNPHEPLSDSAKDDLQTQIDALYDMFVSLVSQNRQMKAALVRNTEAGLFYGAKAISAGLADQVGTYDQALAAVTEAAKARKQVRVAASAAGAQIEGETTMSQEVKKTADAPATPVAPAPQQSPVEVPATAAAPAPTPIAPVPPAAPDAAAIEARVRAESERKAAQCMIARRPDLIPLAMTMTEAQLSEHLLSLAAQESQRTAVQSHTQAAPVGAEAQLNAAATQIAASRNVTFAQAYVQAMTQNPKLYQQYLAEKSAPRPN
jgi:capsid assembly protease